jgi:hypothetical protein
MNLNTRNSEASVEKISNGYIVTCSGRDEDNNYKTEKMFVDSLNSVQAVLTSYFALKED